MELEYATQRASLLLGEMAPHLEQGDIAGSIRRRKPDGIKDLELVVTPRLVEIPNANSLFEEPVWVNRLHEWALSTRSVRWIKPGTSEVVSWEPKPDGKYWRGLLDDGTKLDVFLARPDNFGVIFLIRTGSAEFSEAVVTYAKRIGKPCSGGWFGTPMPNEACVFEYLGLEWVDPEQRTGPEALRVKARAA